MAERTIKVLLFEYYEERTNPANTDQNILVSKLARFGETVDIPRDVDLERGEEFNAFGTQEEVEAIRRGDPLAGGTTGLDATGTEGRLGEGPDGTAINDWSAVNFDELSQEQLTAWISEESPTVDRVLQVATESDDPALVDRLLAAENSSTGNEPRKGVTEGLAKVANDKATNG